MPGPALHPLLSPAGLAEDDARAEDGSFVPTVPGYPICTLGVTVMGRRTTMRKRLTVNIGRQERVARIVVGLVGVVVGEVQVSCPLPPSTRIRLCCRLV